MELHFWFSPCSHSHVHSITSHHPFIEYQLRFQLWCAMYILDDHNTTHHQFVHQCNMLNCASNIVRIHSAHITITTATNSNKNDTNNRFASEKYIQYIDKISVHFWQIDYSKHAKCKWSPDCVRWKKQNSMHIFAIHACANVCVCVFVQCVVRRHHKSHTVQSYNKFINFNNIGRRLTLTHTHTHGRIHADNTSIRWIPKKLFSIPSKYRWRRQYSHILFLSLSHRNSNEFIGTRKQVHELNDRGRQKNTRFRIL